MTNHDKCRHFSSSLFQRLINRKIEGSKKIICESCGVPLQSYERIKRLEEEKELEEIEKLEEESFCSKLDSNNRLTSKISLLVY